MPKKNIKRYKNNKLYNIYQPDININLNNHHTKILQENLKQRNHIDH